MVTEDEGPQWHFVCRANCSLGSCLQKITTKITFKCKNSQYPTQKITVYRFLTVIVSLLVLYLFIIMIIIIIIKWSAKVIPVTSFPSLSFISKVRCPEYELSYRYVHLLLSEHLPPASCLVSSYCFCLKYYILYWIYVSLSNIIILNICVAHIAWDSPLSPWLSVAPIQNNNTH